jgi:hypothetical protein
MNPMTGHSCFRNHTRDKDDPEFIAAYRSHAPARREYLTEPRNGLKGVS